MRFEAKLVLLLQEPLHSSSRHADARNVWVAVRRRGQRFSLTAQNDGKGFDGGGVRGLGLIGMGGRAENPGGAFQVQSRPGLGTLLSVESPLVSPGLQVSSGGL